MRESGVGKRASGARACGVNASAAAGSCGRASAPRLLLRSVELQSRAPALGELRAPWLLLGRNAAARATACAGDS